MSAIDHPWNPCAFPDAEPVPGKRVMMTMILDYELHFICIACLNPRTDLTEPKFREKTTSLASQWQLSLKFTS